MIVALFFKKIFYEIVKNLSSLPFAIEEKTEMEKKFENLILKTQLKLFDNKKIENEKVEISDITKELSKKGTIKEIQKNGKEEKPTPKNTNNPTTVVQETKKKITLKPKKTNGIKI